MHCCLPSGTNKIGELMNCLEKKKETYKKCSFSKDSSLAELKLGQRISPSGFRSRSKRKRYLSSYSLNNLKEIETKFLHEEKHQNDKKVRMCN